MRDEVARREERHELTRRQEREAVAASALAPTAPQRGPDPRNLGWVVAAFLGGILIGAAILLGYAWVAVG